MELRGQYFHGVGAHCVGDDALDSQKPCQSRRPLDIGRVGVHAPEREGLFSPRIVEPGEHGRAELIVGSVVSELDVLVDQCLSGTELILNSARKDMWHGRVGVRNCPHIKSCDEAKITAAATQGNPQIAILSFVSINDSAVGEDDFKVDDVVTGEGSVYSVQYHQGRK